MNTTIISLKAYLSEKLLALPAACPFAGSRSCPCPFHELRTSPRTTREAWIQDLSEDRVLDLLISHQHCLEANDLNHP